MYLIHTCFHGYSAKTGVGEGVSVSVCVGRGVSVKVGVGGGVGVDVGVMGRELHPTSSHIKMNEVKQILRVIKNCFELYPAIKRDSHLKGDCLFDFLLWSVIFRQRTVVQRLDGSVIAFFK